MTANNNSPRVVIFGSRGRQGCRFCAGFGPNLYREQRKNNPMSVCDGVWGPLADNLVSRNPAVDASRLAEAIYVALDKGAGKGRCVGLVGETTSPDAATSQAKSKQSTTSSHTIQEGGSVFVLFVGVRVSCVANASPPGGAMRCA